MLWNTTTYWSGQFLSWYDTPYYLILFVLWYFELKIHILFRNPEHTPDWQLNLACFTDLILKNCWGLAAMYLSRVQIQFPPSYRQATSTEHMETTIPHLLQKINRSMQLLLQEYNAKPIPKCLPHQPTFSMTTHEWFPPKCTYISSNVTSRRCLCVLQAVPCTRSPWWTGETSPDTKKSSSLISCVHSCFDK